MIRNIIFDIGNVLVLFDETNHATKLFGHEKASYILDCLWEKGIGDDFDRGVIPESQVIEKYIDHLPDLKEEILMYIETLGDCMRKFPYTNNWIHELKELGYNIYFLSNYSKWFMRANPSVLDFIKYTDGGVFSCDCHLLKPEKEIFHYICDKYNLKKEECFFIDDLKRNVKGANDFGIRAYHFEDYESSYEEIMNILKEDRNDN